MGYLVTVVLPVKNGIEYLEEVLVALKNQKTNFKFDILAIDSGSKDGTLELLEKFSIRTHHIKPTEFNHGGTRNLGVSLSDSKYVAFLTQDATPATDKWLEEIVRPMEENENVAGVWGKHLARPDCNPIVARDLTEFMDSLGNEIVINHIEKIKDDPNFEAMLPAYSFYSDVNSCLRKSIWEKIPYEPLNYCEDQLWGKSIILAGYGKAYSPFASVYHSHSYKPKEFFKRYFDEYVGFKKSVGFVESISIKQLIPFTINAWKKDYKYIKDKKFRKKSEIYWIYNSFWMNFNKRLAMILARNDHRIKPFFIKFLSRDYKLRKK